MKCCICKSEIEHHKHPPTGKVIWKKGNNAQPVKDGRCCNYCDWNVVIPVRIEVIRRKQDAKDESKEYW